MAEFRNENGVGGSSPRWMASWSHAMVLPSSRGGVPGLEPAMFSPSP
ncbi:MAG: hypothetical protein WDM81_00435 [Rhizomicrobium sp.]